MQRYGIEEEGWFASAKSGLERRGFKLRIQPRSIIIEKEARLPRIVGSARKFLQFAEKEGLRIDPAAFAAADLYGDSRSDLTGRCSASPFETPAASFMATQESPLQTSTWVEERRPDMRKRALLLVCLLAAIAYVVIKKPSLETPEQARNRQSLEQQSDDLKRREAVQADRNKIYAQQRAERVRTVCHDIRNCGHYGELRQECATAGDFALCIKVKWGRNDFSPESMCNDDGTLSNPPIDMPKWNECLASGLDDFIAELKNALTAAQR